MIPKRFQNVFQVFFSSNQLSLLETKELININLKDGHLNLAGKKICDTKFKEIFTSLTESYQDKVINIDLSSNSISKISSKF